MQNKKIILGVSGGIASYKACDLASLLVKDNYKVQTILTDSAQKFISALTFKTITYNDCYTNQFDYDIVEPLHIEMCREADLLVLAPATANLIAKMANGIADDLLTTLICAYSSKKPILLAPAMNTAMWENPIVQANLKTITENLNCTIINPIEGQLACRTEGIGKLAEVENIYKQAVSLLSKNNSELQLPILPEGEWSGLKVLITAGGTKEPIDPVRFLGNRSSGKMGLALADEAYKKGADIILITTQKALKRNYKIIEVETAHELQKAVESYFDTCQILIMSAAVSDFRPLQVFASKVKKSRSESDWYLPLTKNPDILETLGRLKKENQILIGFAAESDNLIQNARKKLENKKLDLIVANQVDNTEIGFGSDYNEVYLLTQKDNSEEIILPKNTKTQIAFQILEFVQDKFLKC
jgi:phosphopantothenoylcysteine decarboxylase / phosphopantothenate---cysteine ligase